MADPWELASWDATETAERIARRDVSAIEVVEAALARAEDARVLNAIVTPMAERARRLASGPARGPLFGVPTAVKDLAKVEGTRIAWGTAASGHVVARTTDPWVRAFEGTGLVAIGKSATPELGMTGTTEPLAFGPTHNPWATSRTPGGSSGGAGALVASGVVPIAHASDGGGSIRIPAACCGLVGLKVTRRRWDMESSPLLPINIASHGALTRSVRDTIALWRAIETERGALRPIGEAATRRKLVIGVFLEAPTGVAVDEEVRAAVEATARACSERGHDVRFVPCPFAGRIVDDFTDYWMFVAWLQYAFGRVLVTPRFDRRKLEPFMVGLARRSAARRRETFRATRRLRALTAEWPALLAPYDVLIGPTLAQPATPLGHLAPDVPFDEAMDRLMAFTPFTGLVNAAGAPALSLPLARTKEGVPIGVHFLARHEDEPTLLALALELEEAMPWPRIAPRPWRA
ncbi:MAG: amidase [Sandaracinus sp.]